MKIKFFIQGKTNPTRIHVRFHDGKTDAKAKTNLVINFSEWSDSKQQPKNLKDDVYKRLNASLERIRGNITNQYNESKGTRLINSEWLRVIFEGIEERYI